MNVLPLLSCLALSQVFWKIYAPTLSLEDPPTWDTNIFMPKDKSSHAPDNGIDEAERIEELRDFASLINDK